MLSFRSFLILLKINFLIVTVSAQCAELNVNKKKVLRYKSRGAYCEGFYIAKVKAQFKLVNFTRGKLYFIPTKDESVTVKLYDNSIKNRLHFKVMGIPLDLYYQLDAYISPGNEFQWDLKKVVQRNSETQNYRNLGLFALDDSISDQNPIYYPVQILKGFRKNSGEQFVITLRHPKSIHSVEWKLSNVDGNCAEEYFMLRDGNEYQKGQKINITLPACLKKGSYTLMVKGRHGSEPKERKRNFKIVL